MFPPFQNMKMGKTNPDGHKEKKQNFISTKFKIMVVVLLCPHTCEYHNINYNDNKRNQWTIFKSKF